MYCLGVPDLELSQTTERGTRPLKLWLCEGKFRNPPDSLFYFIRMRHFWFNISQGYEAGVCGLY